MVDASPLDLSSKIAFQMRHDPADVVGEFELATVLRRDDHPKLVTFAGARLFKRLRRTGSRKGSAGQTADATVRALSAEAPSSNRIGIGGPS
jgi:hypothetical protein